MYEIISLREFARRMDVTDKTVRDAIRLGKIKEGLSSKNGKPKVNFEIAKKEFESFNVGYRAKLRKEPKKEIPTTRSKAKRKTESETNNTESENETEDIENITSSSSLAALQKAEKYYKAQIAKQEFEKEQGQLVYIRDVRVQLASFGQYIKSEIEMLPTNSISKLEDCEGNRAKMLEVLSNDVRSLLLKISDKLNNN